MLSGYREEFPTGMIPLLPEAIARILLSGLACFMKNNCKIQTADRVIFPDRAKMANDPDG